MSTNYKVLIYYINLLFVNILYSSIYLEKNIYDNNHTSIVLRSDVFKKHSHLDGFSRNNTQFISNNTGGKSHYFKIEQNYKNIPFNYNYLRLSCSVSATDLVSYFRPWLDLSQSKLFSRWLLVLEAKSWMVLHRRKNISFYL